jgi:hypothetical protein
MKTTIQISDALLSQVRQLAQKEDTTLKELVEEGLRRVINERAERVPFKLRDASFGGKGLQPEFTDAGWDKIRETIYEAHGG